MIDVSKGSKTDLNETKYTVIVRSLGEPDLVDVAAVLLSGNGKVRNDDDFVFFNNPKGPGVELLSSGAIEVDLEKLPSSIERVLITGSTEAQAKSFRHAVGLGVDIQGELQSFTFAPQGLTTETVLQIVALYRRGAGWRLDAVGQGYSGGLAAFATEHGIEVDEAADQAFEGQSAASLGASAPAETKVETPSSINFEKVKVTLTKDSLSKVAKIDLRKNQGDPNWVLTVGLEWDGRGAVYDRRGKVKRYGSGDLDVYFFCRNEDTNKYVVVSGEPRHRGGLEQWPFILHYGDSKGPGSGDNSAVEQIRVRPNENGDLLVNVYQSVDNGTGAIDTFGKPRVAIRYGRAGRDGLPGADADEIVVHVGNGQNSYWATVAHIDVQDGVLTVDGETRYSRPHCESMPVLDTESNWVQEPHDGPRGRSKRANRGTGLNKYTGRCPEPTNFS
jgi:tellurite resistance protein TerA